MGNGGVLRDALNINYRREKFMAKAKVTKKRRKKIGKPSAPDPAVVTRNNRLTVTDRECDGCGARIGRWTKNCVYDEYNDLAYGAACECSGKWKEAFLCGGCHKAVSPFIPGAAYIPHSRQDIHYCVPCNDKLTEESPSLLQQFRDETQIKKAANSRARKHKSLIHDFDVIASPPKSIIGAFSDRDLKAIGRGPYVVVCLGSSVFQVLRPLLNGETFVRASVAAPTRAFEKCAEFNSAPSKEAAKVVPQQRI